MRYDRAVPSFGAQWLAKIDAALAATAAKVMARMLEGCKDTEFLGPVVTLRSAMSDANRAELAQLADVLAE